jgi:tRNA dimethylallyltransferase
MAFPKRVALIAGATASGKSARAMALARDAGGVIINADAMQVYAELRILTARPSAEDERAATHRLYGHVPGAEAYSVSRWLGDAAVEIEAAWAAGALPIMVGGTGLYFSALEKGLAATPPVPPEIRAKWRARLAEEGAAALHELLRSSDLASYNRLKPMDAQRILRALEVADATGAPIGHWLAKTRPHPVVSGASYIRHFVDVQRSDLYARAEARFDAMLEGGALDEVRRLPALAADLPVMKAIGVPELRSHLAEEITLVEASVLTKTATRHYIKRQLTWWRGQGGPEWAKANRISP